MLKIKRALSVNCSCFVTDLCSDNLFLNILKRNMGLKFIIFLALMSCFAYESTCYTYPNLTQAEYEDVNVEISVVSLSHLFVMTRGFVDVVFQPFYVIEDFIYGLAVNINSGDFLQDLLDQWQTLASFEVGYMVCLCAGLLFILFVPLVAAIMCCCRTCCNNCGGEMIQTKRRARSKWRHCLCGTQLIITIFIFVPCIFVFLTNEWVTQVVDIIPQKSNQSLNDAIKYLDNVPQQFDQVISEYSKLERNLTKDINDVGEKVGGPIRDDFLAQAEPSFVQLRELSSLADSTLQQLEAVDNATKVINSSVGSIEKDLKTVRDNITATLSDPACTGSCADTRDDANKLTLGGDFGALEDLSSQIQKVEESLAYDITGAIDEAEKQINDIPGLVTNNTAEQTKQMLDALQDVNKTLEDSINSLPLDQITQIKTQITELSNTIFNVFDVYQPYDVYRYAAGIVLGSIVALVCFCYLVGTLMGCGGFTNEPSARGCTTNCGGILIMAGVGFSFIFAWILMILVTLTFTVGGHGERYLCQNLETPYAGLAFADRVMEGLNSSIDKTLLQNEDANLTILSIITDCKEEKSIYTALKLEYLFNITELAQNASDQITSLNDLVADFNQTINITIYTDDVKGIFQSLRSAGLGQINFTAFNETINSGIVAVNLTAYAEELNATAKQLEGVNATTMANDLRKSSYDLMLIQTEQVEPLEDDLVTMQNSITALEKTSNSLNDTIDKTETEIIALDDYFKVNGTAVVSRALSAYATNISNDVLGYVDWLVDQIVNHFAICRPVYLIYTQVVSLMCDYLMDVLNALWFSLGWICFFLIPGAIVGMKLAKFYRRLREHDDDDYNEHWNNMEMDTFNRSNNNGIPTSASSKFRSAKIHPSQYY